MAGLGSASYARRVPCPPLSAQPPLPSHPSSTAARFMRLSLPEKPLHTGTPDSLRKRAIQIVSKTLWEQSGPSQQGEHSLLEAMELSTLNMASEEAAASPVPDAESGPSLSDHTIPSGFSRPHPSAAESFYSDISTDRPVRPRQRRRWRGGPCDGSTTVSYVCGGIAIAASVGSLIYGLVGLVEYFTHREHPVYPTATGTVHPIRAAIQLEAERTVTIASAIGVQSVILPSTVQAAITTGLQSASGSAENEWNADSAVIVI